ncbi:hypothetical protein, conserved [Eimeria brunetti]|uniref:Uncharacterized protein n=1 Tax=Eimeria brunetti TaxID=51314 RepID=U6LMX7_9EIME|nr:hypothetical protein, conserved [Eimeria brunetti]
MGATQSHETVTPVIGRTQAVHKPYKSAAIPPLRRPPSESGAPNSPASTVRPCKVKLNGLTAGYVTTCCTTTCKSSLSGASASPETCSTGLSRSANAVAITVSSGSPLERSDSAQAVSSIEDHSPRAFHAVEGIDDAEENTKAEAAKASRWSCRNKRVQGLLKTLGQGAARSRSQPPAGSSSHGNPGNDSATASGRASLAAALHAHILREEEEHRRRRHSSLPESYSELSVSQPHVERWPPSPSESSKDIHSCLPPAGTRCKSATNYRSSSGSNGVAPSIQSRAVEGHDTQKMHVTGQAVVRAVGGGRVLKPSHRTGLGGSRWIADLPQNGRWEMERGTWNRQGVHLNHLNVADERFRALAATRRSPPRQHATQPQGWRWAVGQGQQAPPPQPHKLPIAPLAGRLHESQQRFLQSGHQVVPVTHRGVAAAMTIQIARSRHANEEKRRQQHHLIASPEPEQSMSTAADIHRKHVGATCTPPKFSTVEEMGARNFSTGRESASARNFGSSDLHGSVSRETSVPAPSFRQPCSEKYGHYGIQHPSTTDGPTLPQTGDGGEAMRSDPTPSLPLPVCEKQRQQVCCIPVNQEAPLFS